MYDKVSTYPAEYPRQIIYVGPRDGPPVPDAIVTLDIRRNTKPTPRIWVQGSAHICLHKIISEPTHLESMSQHDKWDHNDLPGSYLDRHQTYVILNIPRHPPMQCRCGCNWPCRTKWVRHQNQQHRNNFRRNSCTVVSCFDCSSECGKLGQHRWSVFIKSKTHVK